MDSKCLETRRNLTKYVSKNDMLLKNIVQVSARVELLD